MPLGLMLADAWLTRTADSLPRIAEFLTAVVAAVAIIGLVRSGYRRSIGRRRDKYARLRRLGTYAQLSFFTSVLGEPPAIRRTTTGQRSTFDGQGHRSATAFDYTEAVWVDTDFYVHAVADDDETVHAFSVTTRTKRFRPSFRPPGATAVERTGLMRWLTRKQYSIRLNPKVVLGRTHFAELGDPNQAASWVGAHNAHYFEAHYYGNPGYYQDFIYSVNDAGAWVWEAPFNAMAPDLKYGFGGGAVDVGLGTCGSRCRCRCRQLK